MYKKRTLPLFLFLFLLSLLLILLDNFGFLKSVRAGSEQITVPIRSVFYQTGQKVSQTISFAIHLQGLNEKNKQLESDLGQFQSLRVKLKVLEKENQALRQQLEAPLPPSVKFLPAKTLGLDRFLIIDKGEDDGVKPGMTVVSENRLVGKVVAATARTSQILLPPDPEAKIPAKSLSTNARGLALGSFGTKVIFSKVLQAETLQKDDLIVTAGDGYLPDLLIGKIIKVEKREVEPFQQAEVEPSLNYQQLENVFIVK